jgi:photosynthetic reaction center cytochrome c subunit
MKLGSRRAILGAATTTMVYLLGAVSAGSQAGTEKPLLSEDAFKNIQLLRGMPVSQFMATMGFFSASLNENCTFCHGLESGGSWEKYADDTPNKQTARKMILMMGYINKTYFDGRRMVTCYSCHRGGERPKVTPNLAEVYGPPAPDDPDEIEQAPGAPTADQILDKYLLALGGSQKLANLTSFFAKGTYQGYDDPEKLPLEMFAKGPGQLSTIVHSFGGDSTTTCDGHLAWVAKPATLAPVPVYLLAGGDLDGVKLDAELFFPRQIKQALGGWRVGFPATINDRDVQVVQGTTSGGSHAKLYFDTQSGLLARLVRYSDVRFGRVPTQIDYADYREVSGVKLPFRWTVTWVDGRSTIELHDVQPNAPIDAERFAKPTPPARSSATPTP